MFQNEFVLDDSREGKRSSELIESASHTIEESFGDLQVERSESTKIQLCLDQL